MSDLGKMEELCRQLGGMMGEALARVPVARRWGFAIMLFEFGEGGNLTWISNAQRKDMIATLREFIGKLEAGSTPGGN